MPGAGAEARGRVSAFPTCARLLTAILPRPGWDGNRAPRDTQQKGLCASFTKAQPTSENGVPGAPGRASEHVAAEDQGSSAFTGLSLSPYILFIFSSLVFPFG